MIAKLTLATLLALPLAAFAGPTLSLEEALSKQQEVEISPVNLSFYAIPAEPSDDATAITAASVCKAAGFIRLVKFSTEACTQGELFGSFVSSHGNPARFQKTSRTCNLSSPVAKTRLASVTCAK